MSSFKKLKGMAGASVVAGAGLMGMMASSARAGVNTGWTSSTGGYFTFHDAGKDWAHGVYFYGTSSTSITGIYSSVSEAALGRTASCTATVTTFWNCYSYTDAYDGVLGVSVNGNGFVPVMSEVVVTDYGIDAGSNVDIATDLDASVQWAFLKDAPVTRGLFSVTNKAVTDAAVTISVRGDWGADGSGGIISTSSGDATVENTDLWVTIADDLVQGNNSDPVITTGIAGPGSTVTTTVVDLDTVEYVLDYTLDIPAGETRSIVVFHQMSKSINDAADIEPDFESGATLNQAGLLVGLTNEQRAQVVNYELPRAKKSGGGVAGGLLGVLGLLGVARLRRRK